MTRAPETNPDTISPRLIQAVRDRLAANKQVRRTLPVWGRLHIDRQLPFLCVYRRPLVGMDEGTQRLVTSEASYLTAPGIRKYHTGLAELVQAVATRLVEEFGAFLILEIWSGEAGMFEGEAPVVRFKPGFRMVAPRGSDLGPFIDSIENVTGLLERVRVGKHGAAVAVNRAAKCCPPSLPPLMTAARARELGCQVLGLEVRPIYRDPASGKVYPLVLRELRRKLSPVMRQIFFDFARNCTTHQPAHYQMLGRRAVVKAVWTVDEKLAEVSNSFDTLLQVTPVNAAKAWREFKRAGFEKQPVFRYRPLPADPVLLKRKLYEIPVERVEDPALLHLFRDKQDELERRITMLQDINTSRFVHGSIQLYGGVEDSLLKLARRILDTLPSRTRDEASGGRVDAQAFAARAENEIEFLRRQWPKVNSGVDIRDDLAGGLMVSRGRLLISRSSRFPASRVDALLQHEVGTHVLTYFNGRAQPFRQLYSGLAGYEPLQEGLAVTAEYLTGGMSRPRLRVLAARVVAVGMMLDGSTFIETFRYLDRDRDFDQRTAYNITMRVYRGGGLTKDAVYLRGLCQLLDYLGNGGALDPLFVGKIATIQIPIVRELQWREVLMPAPLRPRYLDTPEVSKRLEHLRTGIEPLDLVGK